MKLLYEQSAPYFSVPDITGATIDLESYRGKKTLICFLRYAGCPFCNLLLSSLVERYPRYHDKGLEIIAFVQSPRESVTERSMERQNPKPVFPIIADPEREIYEKYGVEVSATKAISSLVKTPLSFMRVANKHFPQGKIDGSLLLMPAFFLVQPDLTIYKSYYTADFSTGIPDIDILDFLLFK
ncbi:MAG: peroxiredoxin-like family protein [Candidatus Saccharimonadales bacterium]